MGALRGRGGPHPRYVFRGRRGLPRFLEAPQFRVFCVSVMVGRYNSRKKFEASITHNNVLVFSDRIPVCRERSFSTIFIFFFLVLCMYN